MTKGPEKRDKRFSLRIPESVLKRMQTAARADRRSAADWVLLLVERELAARDRRKHK
jgi:predicted HicB family RNase H-like nuclease